MILTDPQLAQLAEVLRRYESARLGELNKTADELQACCRALGWERVRGPYLPWARLQVRGEGD